MLLIEPGDPLKCRGREISVSLARTSGTEAVNSSYTLHLRMNWILAFSKILSSSVF